MKNSINHLGEYAETLTTAYQSPFKRRRRFAYAAGGALLGGVGAALSAPAVFAAGAAGVAGKVSAALLASKGLSAALGSYNGYRLANNYLGELKSFEFVSLTDAVDTDATHQYIFINGFLSQDDAELADWRSALETLREQQLNTTRQANLFPDITQAPCWHLNWESKRLAELNHSFAGPGVKSLLTRQWRSAPLGVITQLADNAWHHALLNAKKSGRLLADAIMQSPPHQQFTIVGHSLGARVAFYALQTLATEASQRVRDVVLLGAAQGRRNRDLWLKAESACSGQLYNCFSTEDSVLRWAYQSINVGMSRPAGLGPAPLPVANIDCSALVNSHSRWKENLPAILAAITASTADNITPQPLVAE
ncbi:hypothetical protein CWE12_00855 [Aliidiomarina sedimenti]|uniref:DUF726 domain-containing protein n=1 Tax=Aliidiomarina sedimenti TaxID=1933879 RepID=A0ABY0C1P5_9GAMM|nr:alpha/beta fold hydrolase [Aliidiomarina sedimenti]RUO31579.1 hypothetical protein CWE12_00855 [Aliidiomarina sedimenti]